jgi:hypothetical protein
VQNNFLAEVKSKDLLKASHFRCYDLFTYQKIDSIYNARPILYVDNPYKLMCLVFTIDESVCALHHDCNSVMNLYSCELHSYLTSLLPANLIPKKQMLVPGSYRCHNAISLGSIAIIHASCLIFYSGSKFFLPGSPHF